MHPIFFAILIFAQYVKPSSKKTYNKKRSLHEYSSDSDLGNFSRKTKERKIKAENAIRNKDEVIINQNVIIDHKGENRREDVETVATNSQYAEFSFAISKLKQIISLIANMLIPSTKASNTKMFEVDLSKFIDTLDNIENMIPFLKIKNAKNESLIAELQHVDQYLDIIRNLIIEYNQAKILFTEINNRMYATLAWKATNNMMIEIFNSIECEKIIEELEKMITEDTSKIKKYETLQFKSTFKEINPAKDIQHMNCSDRNSDRNRKKPLMKQQFWVKVKFALLK